ncbi:alpha/beta fold hydrolase [Williamsia sterculiae]|uniref:Pimeloyl-ACP methyl ester carboxylesterase n=1 Tax=Williamsia sterculiae TaxID=1344003 RepID=A0A1N7EXF3_9NOCA|nr:alpha/beta hydrolase [Williamsia sterculiae]SIR92712.1 Pimeloyl-ACP methyl ester carboxylesterase [Williamsia sterculiae]
MSTSRVNARKVVKTAGLTGLGVGATATLAVGTILGALLREAITAPPPVDDGPDQLLATPSPIPERIDVRGNDGAKLNVLAYGPPDGDLIVFAHGWTCNTTHWFPQLNVFAATHRVVVYDQRGHGRSEMGDVKASPELLGQDLHRVLQAVVPEGRRALIAGHSMGGMTILSWAMQHPREIDRYARAVILNSTAAAELMERLAVIPDGLPGYTRPFRRLVSRLIASAPVPLPHTPYSTRVTQYIALNTTARLAHVEFVDGMVRSCPALARARWGAAMSAISLTEGVRALDVLTAVVVGTDDRLTPKLHADTIVDLLKQSGNVFEYLVLPDVGHMSNIEASEEYNALVTRLLSATEGRRTV